MLHPPAAKPVPHQPNNPSATPGQAATNPAPVRMPVPKPNVDLPWGPRPPALIVLKNGLQPNICVGIPQFSGQSAEECS